MMKITVTKVRDDLGVELRRALGVVKNLQPLHRAIGVGLVSMGKRAWVDASKRPMAWVAKVDGSVATLRKSGTLAKSIRAVATGKSVVVGSDRHYAAIHQLGGVTRPHVIRAKNGKALKFGRGAVNGSGIGRGMGAVNVFVKGVKHPGSKIPARPFLPFDGAGRPTAEARALIVEIVGAKLGVVKK